MSSSLKLFLAFLLLIVLPARAKCPALFVSVRGNIVGAIPDEGKVKLQISSSAHDDRLVDVKQESSIQNSHFEAKAWFDTFEKMEHGEHICSRKPGKVVISLTKGQDVVASRVLTIEKDFKLTSEGDYEVSVPVTLRLR